jgi:hypothetical protein
VPESPKLSSVWTDCKSKAVFVTGRGGP